MPGTSTSLISIPALMKSLFRLLDEVDAPLQQQVRSAVAAGSAMQDIISQSRQSGDPLLRVLVELDRKMDVVIGLLQRESLHQDFPLEGKVTELGAESLVLETREKLAPEQRLELVLLPDDYYSRSMSVVAKVEMVMPDAAQAVASGTPYRLSYSSLSEEDKDALIRFIFSEERKRIRQQRSE